jgi:hypothetical protein
LDGVRALAFLHRDHQFAGRSFNPRLGAWLVGSAAFVLAFCFADFRAFCNTGYSRRSIYEANTPSFNTARLVDGLAKWDKRSGYSQKFALGLLLFVAAVVFCALACNYLLYRTHGMVDGFGVFNRLPAAGS